MTRATLSEVLSPAMAQGYAVPGFVCQGWEDAEAYALAAADEGAPVILQVGPGARAHMPIAVWGAMLGHLADASPVPMVIHLDHGRDEGEARVALASGFTSIMFDGSALPLAENIAQTARIVRMAHAAGASCEGELGFVGYEGGRASVATVPAEAARFAVETGVDALAVAVGNVHLQESAGAGIDRAALEALAQATGHALPLVLHGGSGIPADQRRVLARETAVAKFNIGTELRQVFGASLRQKLAAEPGVYDRLAILSACREPLREAARLILRDLGAAGKG